MQSTAAKNANGWRGMKKGTKSFALNGKTTCTAGTSNAEHPVLQPNAQTAGQLRIAMLDATRMILSGTTTIVLHAAARLAFLGICCLKS